MDRKRFAKYFAQKPPVVLYVVGGVLLAAGVLIVLIQGGVYNAMSYYIGIPAAVLGLLILGVTRGIVIRDAEADKQLDLLAARADAELPDALRLTAKELETDRVPFKSYIYENDDATYKRGTDKRLRSSEIGAGVFLLCNPRFCALYRTASLVEEREDVCAFEAAYAAITDAAYVAAEYETMRLTVRTADGAFSAIVPNDALMDEFFRTLNPRAPKPPAKKPRARRPPRGAGPPAGRGKGRCAFFRAPSFATEGCLYDFGNGKAASAPADGGRPDRALRDAAGRGGDVRLRPCV